MQPRHLPTLDRPEDYMRRALQLARLGEGNVSPNPMVGAVVVAPDGRIIGEGYHRRFGEGHAEVNALASVDPSDWHLLKESTMYVTLEPCSHYGKTPPCAKLIIDTGLKKVVAAATDPFPAVSGRGMRMLSEAGIETETGLLEAESLALNKRFMTAHRLGRPWVQLKWAETAEGDMARIDERGESRPIAISGPVERVWMHRQRSLSDAIMVGSKTVATDNPKLDCRCWKNPSAGHEDRKRPPRKVTFRSERIPADSTLARDKDTIYLEPHAPLLPQLERLYREEGITSIMVEGGAETLESFRREGLADELRQEVQSIHNG